MVFNMERTFGFNVNVMIIVERQNTFSLIMDKAKRIKQADKKEYCLLKSIGKEFNFSPDDIIIDQKGKRWLILSTKDFIKFVPMKVDNSTLIPIDIKKLSIYTETIKRVYEDTQKTNVWVQYLPIIAIIVFAIGFVIMGNFVLEQIQLVSGSLGGVASALNSVADKVATNCLARPV